MNRERRDGAPGKWMGAAVVCENNRRIIATGTVEFPLRLAEREVADREVDRDADALGCPENGHVCRLLWLTMILREIARFLRVKSVIVPQKLAVREKLSRVVGFG